MLILSRKPNEKIRIGSDIVISIVSVSDNNIKIGIDAPKDVKILREEIYENVKQHTEEAKLQSIAKPASDLSKLKINKLTKSDSEQE